MSASSSDNCEGFGVQQSVCWQKAGLHLDVCVLKLGDYRTKLLPDKKTLLFY